MTVWFDSTELRVFLSSLQASLASYCFDFHMWDIWNPTLFLWVPWNLLQRYMYKEQCLTGNYVMCVIAHDERCVSLWPLSHLCGDLAVWIWIALFDKGTRNNISQNLMLLCFCLASKTYKEWIPVFFLQMFLEPTSTHTVVNSLMCSWYHHQNLNSVWI